MELNRVGVVGDVITGVHVDAQESDWIARISGIADPQGDIRLLGLVIIISEITVSRVGHIVVRTQQTGYRVSSI